jgi:hypothetical protein
MSERDACEVVLELIDGMYKSSVESSSVVLGWGFNWEELLWRRDMCNAKSSLAVSPECNQQVMLSYMVCAAAVLSFC